jgi:prevent-host-death family protein
MVEQPMTAHGYRSSKARLHWRAVTVDGLAPVAGASRRQYPGQELAQEISMATYSIAEAQGRLSELVDAANAGEAVTLTRSGKPVAVLQPAGEARGRMTPEMLDRLAELRAKWPPLSEDAVTAVRALRDDFP